MKGLRVMMGFGNVLDQNISTIPHKYDGFLSWIYNIPLLHRGEPIHRVPFPLPPFDSEEHIEQEIPQMPPFLTM